MIRRRLVLFPFPKRFGKERRRYGRLDSGRANWGDVLDIFGDLKPRLVRALLQVVLKTLLNRARAVLRVRREYVS
jgi:phage/plasmid-associated DNA primase